MKNFLIKNNYIVENDHMMEGLTSPIQSLPSFLLYKCHKFV